MFRVTRRCKQTAQTALTLSVVFGWAFAASSAFSVWAQAEDTPPPPPATAPPSLAPDTPPTSAAAAENPSAKTEVPPPPPVESAPKVASEKPEPSASPTTEPSAAAEGKVAKEESKESPPVNAQAEPTPTPSASAEDARQENVVVAKHQGRVPYYQTIHPAWGVEIAGSLSSLGGKTIEPAQADAKAPSVEIQAEYQLPFFQNYGVFSVGPSFSLIPIGTDGSVTRSPASIWAVGGQIRYQGRYFHEQPVVPMVGLELQHLTYHFVDGNSGGTNLAGPFLGAMFLLNILEPTSASELYIENGITRSYLVAELKMLSGSDNIVTVSGSSFFFGLRFEF